MLSSMTNCMIGLVRSQAPSSVYGDTKLELGHMTSNLMEFIAGMTLNWNLAMYNIITFTTLFKLHGNIVLI